MCLNNNIPRNILSSRILHSVDLQAITDVSGHTVDSLFKNFCSAVPLKMGSNVVPKRRCQNYHSTLHNIPEERGSYLYSDGKRNSRNIPRLQSTLGILVHISQS